VNSVYRTSGKVYSSYLDHWAHRCTDDSNWLGGYWSCITSQISWSTSSVGHALDQPGDVGPARPFVGPVAPEGPGGGAVELVLCVGSTHVLGGHRETLRALRRWGAPGGQVVVGVGFWQQEPAQEYLGGFGESRDELTTHAENVAVALDEGLIPSTPR